MRYNDWHIYTETQIPDTAESSDTAATSGAAQPKAPKEKSEESANDTDSAIDVSCSQSVQARVQNMQIILF